MSAEVGATSGRMLLFEIGGTRYALPINGVREVAELGRIGCVPGMPLSAVGVTNWHGDALPVVSPRRIFEDALPEGADAGGGSEHVLVVSDRSGDRVLLGLPVDRVLGLVDAALPRASTPGLVTARQPVDGRVVSVLDPQQLRARAEAVIAEVLG